MQVLGIITRHPNIRFLDITGVVCNNGFLPEALSSLTG
jgi:hypothetical protein